MKRQSIFLINLTLFSCIAMALVETLLQPGYAIKSAIKIALFLGSAGVYFLRFRSDAPKALLGTAGLLPAAALGAGLYGFLLLMFFLFRPFIDLDAIARGLLTKEGVTAGNFLWVALYISLVNSFLEELFFRGLGYLTLRRHMDPRLAGVFSALAFAAYHVAILDGWFSWWMLGLCLTGLFVGGLIFNALDRRGSLLPSWIVHACANLAINTMGLIMFDSL